MIQRRMTVSFDGKAPLEAPQVNVLYGATGTQLDWSALVSAASNPAALSIPELADLGVRSMRLLSNNPRKLVGVEGYGLTVSEWIPLEIPASDSSRRYLKTKKDKMGHKLSSV